MIGRSGWEDAGMLDGETLEQFRQRYETERSRALRSLTEQLEVAVKAAADADQKTAAAFTEILTPAHEGSRFGYPNVYDEIYPVVVLAELRRSLAFARRLPELFEEYEAIKGDGPSVGPLGSEIAYVRGILDRIDEVNSRSPGGLTIEAASRSVGRGGEVIETKTRIEAKP